MYNQTHTGSTHADLERQLLDLLYIVCVNRTDQLTRNDRQDYNKVFCEVAKEILDGIAKQCGKKYEKL